MSTKFGKLKGLKEIKQESKAVEDEPKKEEVEIYTLRFDSDLLERVRVVAAKDKKLKIYQIVNTAVREYMDRNYPER